MSNQDVQYIRPPTPEVDPKVAALAGRLTEPKSTRDIDSGEDEILAELEAEIEDGHGLVALREQRLEELQQEIAKVKDMRENQHGQYSEIMDEKEVIRTTANEPRCVIHFYHRDFRRCQIMDKHLQLIAPKYFSTRFIRVFVENVPWLVEKLAIKVLPCVVCFVGGVSKDRFIGFEELGNNDAFETAALEMRLSMSGVLQKPKPAMKQKTTYGSSLSSPSLRGIRGRGGDGEDYDSDE